MVIAETATGFFPSPGETIAGKYEIERMLGQGGMGAVFSAQNRLTGRRVALKWLLPDKATAVTRERLEREARIATSVRHPNVVDVLDMCEHEGGLFIVMEYLQGDSLAMLLEERGHLEPEELIGLLMPTLRGVQAAHDAGIIHRDLKPDNILLCDMPSGELLPKVLDFGISKTLSDDSPLRASLTSTGALIGTPHFMALEQVDGSGDIDVRTDVYAFGVMLYLGLTGQLPFDGENIGELVLKIGTRSAIAPRDLQPSIPPALEQIVLKAMARRREERYCSVTELALALEPFSGGVPFERTTGDVTARRIPLTTDGKGGSNAAHTPTSVEPPPRSRARFVAMILGLAALLLAGGGVWLGWRTPTPPSAAADADRATEARPAPAVAAPPPQTRPALPAAPEPHEEDQETGEHSIAASKSGASQPKTADANPEEPPEAARRRARKRRARRQARRKLAPHDKNADNRIEGQRTPGFSADDF